MAPEGNAIVGREQVERQHAETDALTPNLLGLGRRGRTGTTHHMYLLWGNIVDLPFLHKRARPSPLSNQGSSVHPYSSIQTEMSGLLNGPENSMNIELDSVNPFLHAVCRRNGKMLRTANE
jgi:hypothetical protein